MAISELAGPDSGIRKLPTWGYVAVAVVYLGIIQVVGRLATSGMDIEFASPQTTGEVWRSLTISLSAAAVFVYAVVAVLGWWKPVFRDDVPTQPWVRIIPILMFATIVLAVNYPGLADKGIGFTALLLVSGLLVGLGEEGMYRGIGVVAFRRNGYSEGKVALWTTVIFAASHATNVFSEGPRVILQVLVTVLAGYLFYLIRRYSGGLFLPIVVHGLWDFALISSYISDDIYPGALLFLLANVVLLVIVLVRRHRISPASVAIPTPA